MIAPAKAGGVRCCGCGCSCGGGCCCIGGVGCAGGAGACSTCVGCCCCCCCCCCCNNCIAGICGITVFGFCSVIFCKKVTTAASFAATMDLS
ncbi:hypothetical protein HanXRQr2_Chr10g0420121 [Helianthus annuus]|uniref:Uncharacterized protein n=1 Tax=Helianthus annuus TaxID=4232 RepID=A0A9K3HUV5_HELAN|nr:hypothetical protein HanXRQr2_Chr10g0420121 [Helianthus annuus]KAJ0528499.1 hypothetical protein HanHA89_Chr10g0367081 [Helianthus annuus]